MNDKTDYQARCFCGDVRFSLSGQPEVMAYCHCNSCRHWSAGPVSAFTLWKKDAIQITQGADNIAAFNKNPGTNDEAVVSIRKWCKTCGGHLFTEHPGMGLVDIPAVIISDIVFKPGFHAHYQETVLHMKDGLPKFKDLPKEAGGSGDEIPE